MKLMLVGLLAASVALQDPVDQTRKSVEKTRAQKSYSATFKGDFRIPNSDPMILEGESVWITPGILFLKYKASGGDEVRVVRAGEKVWMYHLQVEDWVPAEEAGRGGAGRGLQNPDEVLALILKVVAKAKSAGKEKVDAVECDKIDIALAGEDMGGLMKEQGNQGTFDWAKSSGQINLDLGPDGLLLKLNVTAELTSTKPELKDKKVNYKAEVQVKSFQKDFAMSFTTTDPKTQKETPLPVSEEILAEIEKTKNIPDELKSEIARLRKVGQK